MILSSALLISLQIDENIDIFIFLTNSKAIFTLYTPVTNRELYVDVNINRKAVPSSGHRLQVDIIPDNELA